jgi:hypothetical protein
MTGRCPLPHVDSQQYERLPIVYCVESLHAEQRTGREDVVPRFAEQFEHPSGHATHACARGEKYAPAPHTTAACGFVSTHETFVVLSRVKFVAHCVQIAPNVAS